MNERAHDDAPTSRREAEVDESQGPAVTRRGFLAAGAIAATGAALLRPTVRTGSIGGSGLSVEAFPLLHANPSVPTLPPTSLGDTKVAEQAVINALAGQEDVGIPYPPPTRNVMPAQASGPRRRRIA